MKRPAHVELRIGPEQDTAGIHQEQVGARYRGSQRAIDIRAKSPGHATQNVVIRRGTVEAGNVASAHAELAETVKLIYSADDSPAVDVIDISGSHYRSAERGIRPDRGRHLGVASAREEGRND